MNNAESLTLAILGREYRFKHPLDKLSQLTGTAAELDARLQQLHTELPLATRDQLLILTALNLLGEQSEQQQQMAETIKQLVNKINEAG